MPIKASPKKTTEQRLASLQGQVMALSHYLRATLARLPPDLATAAILEAEGDIRQMADRLLAMPFPEDLFEGAEMIQSHYFQLSDDKT